MVGLLGAVVMTFSLPGIGAGTWAWGNRFLWNYNPAQDDGPILAAFQGAVAAGVRFFDTADSYGTGPLAGRSELLLGQALASLPAALQAQLVVATKLAPFPWRRGRRGFDRAFAASRARLGGRLDRVQLHWSTARYAPWQEGPLLEGLADLVQAGVVRELGVSNMGPKRLRRWQRLLAERGVPLASVQVQLSLLCRDPLGPGGVAELCEELGLGLIAYSPLALGLLSGRWQLGGALPAGPRGQLFRRLLPAIEPLRTELAAVAGRMGATAPEVALNWCRAHGALPIPGLRRPEQVLAVAGALGWVLPEEERQRLDQVAAKLEVRMPANPFGSA